MTVPASSAGTVEGYFIPGGMYGGYSGYYVWEDYCPVCNNYDCLLVNPKGVYEGEVTCGSCDCDFDGCTGADKHAEGAYGWLTPYTPPEPSVHENQTIHKKPVVSKKEIAQKYIHRTVLL